jgi:mono/diheme cytochrome c family protein
MKTSLSIAAIFSFSLIAFLSCNSEPNTPDAAQAVTISEAELAKGFQLLETNCFSCHSPNATVDNRIAPPMFGVKTHYLGDGVSREKFVADIVAYMNNPTEENSKMPGAVKRFGLMPKMNFTEEQINAIANYLYVTELEKPGWFDAHYEAERKKYMAATDTSLTPLEIGQKLAMQTKGVLGKNLLNAINTKGTEGALDFCNTRALPLTDSMAVALNASIKRVSDKNRNPKNAANAAETAFISQGKALLAKGEKVKPKMQEINGKMVGYYPIMTDKMCLQCHGQAKTDVLPATLERIAKHYPTDKATGYAVDELRGIWVVEMEKK